MKVGRFAHLIDMRRRNVIAAIVLLTLGAGYAVLTAGLPTRGIENTTEPSFFPWVIVTCLMLLSGALLVQGLWLPAAGKPVAERAQGSGALYLAGFLAFTVYLALLPFLGFVAANIPFFAVLMLLYGERRPVWVIAGSMAISLVLFFLFREVFQIRLPAGVLSGVIA